MTKVIWIFIVVLVIFCGWQGFKYGEKVMNEKEQKVTVSEVRPESLSGMPYSLENGYSVAKQKGPAVMRTWLKTHGSMVADPRRAWIELDFCVSLARENPAEARSVFAEVKQRTPESSPVWPRIKQLEKTFE